MTPISRATDYAVRILSALQAAQPERVTAAALAQATSIPADQVARCAAHVIWLEAERALRRVLAQHTMAGIAARMRALDVFNPRIEVRLVQDERPC